MKKWIFLFVLLISAACYAQSPVMWAPCLTCVNGTIITLNGDIQSIGTHTHNSAATFNSTVSIAGAVTNVGGIQGANTKTLTESSATNFVQVSVPAGSFTGGIVQYCINADDATDFQARCGTEPFSVVNKAGTETCAVGTPGAQSEIVAVSAGTLTNTFTCDTSPTNGIFLASNAVSSLTQTTLSIKYRINIFSGTATVTPQ